MSAGRTRISSSQGLDKMMPVVCCTEDRVTKWLGEWCMGRAGAGLLDERCMEDRGAGHFRVSVTWKRARMGWPCLPCIGEIGGGG